MATKFPTVVENAREELLSSDVNRAQTLASTTLQNELMYEVLDTSGVPISVFTKTPTCAGVVGTYNANVSAGEAISYDGSIVDPDSSPMNVLQWPAQTLILTPPDSTNGRVDLIVAAPNQVGTDPSVRNVLQDPNTRAFAPTTVPKTSRPIATLSVVTGTPAATPLPPAVPAGTVPLFEVYAAAASADSSAWPVVPRLFRKAGYPFTGMTPVGETSSGGAGVALSFAPSCGIIRGCRLANVALAGVIIGTNASGGYNAVCIDGEVIEFAVTQSAGADTLNPPVGPANAQYDLPVFLYIVGGRNLPSNNLTGNPVQMVYSTTPPNVTTGRPSAPIGTSRGNTSSAVFVGVGFMLKNASTFRGVDYRENDWAFPGTGGGLFSQNQDITGSGAFTVNAAPSIADSVIFSGGLTFPGGGTGTLILGDYEEETADPGAITLIKNGIIKTRLDAGVIASAAVVGLTLARLGALAFHIPGIRRLG